MTDEQFDQVMRQALSPEPVPGGLLRKTKQKMEERTMMNLPRKRKMVVVLACCLALTAMAVGAAQAIRRSTLSSTMTREYEDYGQLSRVLKILGFACHVPEKLPGGYAFVNMSITQNTALGDGNSHLYEYQGLMVDYQNREGGSVSLSMAKKADEDWGVEAPHAVEGNAGTLKGIPVDAGVRRYRFVPPTYQVSEEEKALQEAGELYISYGAKEVEEREIANVSFVMEGIDYELVDMEHADLELLLAMAEAIMED